MSPSKPSHPQFPELADALVSVDVVVPLTGAVVAVSVGTGDAVSVTAGDAVVVVCADACIGIATAIRAKSSDAASFREPLIVSP